MTKRYHFAFVVICLALLSFLVACGGQPEAAPPEAEPAEEQPAEEPAEPEEAEPTEAVAPAEPTEAEAPAEEPTEAPPAEMEEVTLSMILVAPEDRWTFLLDAAEAKFEADHPEIDIVVDAQVLPFGDRLTQLRAAAAGGTPLDIVSLDQPEVGEFAAAGFTTDLTEWINRDLDGLSDWRPAHRAATLYNGGYHAIWAWTDARVMWYWKDLVEQAGVDPATDMTTWEDYIAACQTLNEALAGENIQGCLQIGQPWISDWTLPYVWEQGGDIGLDVNADLAAGAGAAEAWVPTFDSEAWVSALQFTRDQIDAGITPFTEHQFGTEFVARSFATTLDGTWVYGAAKTGDADMANLGLVAAFPVPSADVETATMAGGWTLAIPSTSEHAETAWEFLKAMLDVSTLGAMQVQYGYLPTETSFAEGLNADFAAYWNEGGDDRWAALQGLLPNAYGRPSFPTWPEVGAAITEMIQRVQFEDVDPQTAATEAQQTVLVDILGWPEGTTVSLLDDSDEACPTAETDRLIGAVTPWQQAADANGNGQICSSVTLP